MGGLAADRRLIMEIPMKQEVRRLYGYSGISGLLTGLAMGGVLSGLLADMSIRWSNAMVACLLVGAPFTLLARKKYQALMRMMREAPDPNSLLRIG